VKTNLDLSVYLQKMEIVYSLSLIKKLGKYLSLFSVTKINKKPRALQQNQLHRMSYNNYKHILQQ